MVYDRKRLSIPGLDRRSLQAGGMRIACALQDPRFKSPMKKNSACCVGKCLRYRKALHFGQE